jgi:hypothetical protein
VRPSTKTTSSLLYCPFRPRALIAHVLELICATSIPGTMRSKSGIFVAPLWRISSWVITKTAEAVSESSREVLDTEVTRTDIKSSILICVRSVPDGLTADWESCCARAMACLGRNVRINARTANKKRCFKKAWIGLAMLLRGNKGVSTVDIAGVLPTEAEMSSRSILESANHGCLEMESNRCVRFECQLCRDETRSMRRWVTPMAEK